MLSPTLPVVDRMQVLLQKWEQEEDRRAIFLSCYRLMTVNMLVAIRLQEFHDPLWVDSLLNHFAGYYFIALEAYEQDSPATPAIWRKAFEAAKEPETMVMQNLLLGVNAHINFDLIFTLVDVLQREWPSLTQDQRAQRYADHNHVNEVIYRTVDVVQDTVIEPRQPLMDIIDHLLGRVDEWAISGLIRAWRDQVWEDAVKLLEAGDPVERQRLTYQVEIAALKRASIILRLR